MIVGKLRATISKARDGSDYLQVMSDDMMINVVLVAEEIVIEDLRKRVLPVQRRAPGAKK